MILRRVEHNLGPRDGSLKFDLSGALAGDKSIRAIGAISRTYVVLSS